MTDDELIQYYAEAVPADEALLSTLGLVTWAAVRLQHAVRDCLGLDLGSGLSSKPFDRTLGQVVADLVSQAELVGEPWSSEMTSWRDAYGRPAVDERNSIVHAVAYTAPDGGQALRATQRHGGHRITIDELRHAAGHLALASVRLHEARRRCTKELES